jgi:hypothetical protein
MQKSTPAFLEMKNDFGNCPLKSVQTKKAIA